MHSARNLSLGVFVACSCLGLVWVAATLIGNSRQLSFSDHLLGRWTKGAGRWAPQFAAAEHHHLVEELYERVAVYEGQIQAQHLLDGMIVSRNLDDGSVLDQCDSLLFSSLRYAALLKLGLKKEAALAWQAISASQDRGDWPRHPICVHPSSRDMILGLLIAFSQQPPHKEFYFRKLLWVVARQNGYFSHGGPSVSLLTPSMAENMRQLALSYQMHDYEIPWPVGIGFSTLEFDSLFLEKGYTSHLLALQTWLELENQRQPQQHSQAQKPRSLIAGVAPLLTPLTLESVYDQRLSWISSQLVATDSRNMFFRWLRLRAAGHLTLESRLHFIQELLAMPQFPREGLPQNCHRKADYLWQRKSLEFQPNTQHCSLQFPGVDFLWMAALLVDADTSPPLIDAKLLQQQVLKVESALVPDVLPLTPDLKPQP